ncbi:hypothetical protein FA95DRAFT_1609231 [Auriscalpium vulgare]|uniref:Uncharacterized protein n=1 Tax=Auriscalpium vulgare TaxID=40419 RepID=A0ACB8RHN9_9AGAM|nr:hypothetical protein FA95DRAFT_1609231 [Auriscalpium vulgare]
MLEGEPLFIGSAEAMVIRSKVQARASYLFIEFGYKHNSSCRWWSKPGQRKLPLLPLHSIGQAFCLPSKSIHVPTKPDTYPPQWTTLRPAIEIELDSDAHDPIPVESIPTLSISSMAAKPKTHSKRSKRRQKAEAHASRLPDLQTIHQPHPHVVKIVRRPTSKGYVRRFTQKAYDHRDRCPAPSNSAPHHAELRMGSTW